MAIVIAVLVLSHWVLDVLTHRPDMPITLIDSSLIGFGLWNFPVVAVPLELLLFGAGHMAVHPPYKTIKSSGQHWFLGAHFISAGGLCSGPSWTAAAVRDSCGVVRTGTMASHCMGLLG